ncbi:MAG: gamma-glutamyl-gamma-aminobutyrate hydrolase family protein [Erysipelotrichaceae bacterium]|nr:gamma-glutamyl-gamma-aminobutyrate hydrolase family protein [Erysipelotrichaceae bacterium]
MKPIIGVMPLYDDNKNSWWMLPEYCEAITAANGIPVIFPFGQDDNDLKALVNICDGFLLTGGQDVDPELYHEPNRSCGPIVDLRDKLELTLMNEAIAANKPILGICRGHQFINVYFGGNLYQDIPSDIRTTVNHNQDHPYDVPVHQVTIIKDSPLDKLLHKQTLEVNSLHHQAIKELAPDLKAMAVAGDGLIEAVCHKDYDFIWGVQWHPEYAYKKNDFDLKIIQEFINRCL